MIERNRKELNKLYKLFEEYRINDLQFMLDTATRREERLFYLNLLNLKLGLSQEKVVKKELL